MDDGARDLDFAPGGSLPESGLLTSQDEGAPDNGCPVGGNITESPENAEPARRLGRRRRQSASA